VAVGQDGLLAGAVGTSGSERLADTAFVSLYRIDFIPGYFSATPAMVVTPQAAAPLFTGEDNVCVVENLSADSATVACSDFLGNGDGQRADATVFSFIAVGPP
jgi:hypothetical protein